MGSFFFSDRGGLRFEDWNERKGLVEWMHDMCVRAAFFSCLGNGLASGLVGVSSR